MRTHLPSLTSLRAFEASARHLSFTQAAIDLNLTPTAISHQVKNLEQLIGARLFIRTNNSLSLTKAAEAYLESVRAAIVAISVATDRAAENSDESVLTVQCLGTFAIKRLVPMLSEFQKLHPQIKLNLRTIQLYENRLHDNFDVAIWHGDGTWEGVTAEKLEEEFVTPVCSPALITPSSPLDRPSDLARHQIIRTQTLILQDEWPHWLDMAGVRGLKFRAEITCDYLITSLQAAVDGLGVIIGRSGVIGPDIAAGRLVAPFDLKRQTRRGYHLVVPARCEGLTKVEKFREWIKESFAAGPVRPASISDLATGAGMAPEGLLAEKTSGSG